jgi:CRISPR-associated protein Cmr4
MSSYLTFVHALSSLHPGTGQGSGIIDLPIAREKATGLPYLPGSSLKGALRTSCKESIQLESGKTIKRGQIFGSEETDVASNTAGTIQISDQRLLLLPVRSLAGTFAWVTSPYVLHRLARDMVEMGYEKLEVPGIKNMSQALVVNDHLNGPQVASASNEEDACQLLVSNEGAIYLEDLDLRAEKQRDTVRKWADWLGQQIFPEDKDWQLQLHQRICVVHDDVFSFLLKTATEVIARIRLEEESKTVKKGGLWYEEALPTETVLSGLALVTPRSKAKNGQEELTAKQIGEAFQALTRKNLQLGGKATVGRGQCRVLLVEEGVKRANS